MSDPHYLNTLCATRRRVAVTCRICDGLGCKWYSSGATWRGGIGAASITWDVCDHCWGSGDNSRHWTNVRELLDTFEQRVKEEAVTRLARAAGADMSLPKPAIEAIAMELDKLSRGRKERPQFFRALCENLARVLRKGVEKL